MKTPERKHRRTWHVRMPRAEWLVALTLVLVVFFLGWLAVQVIVLTHDLRSANMARDALASQVQSLGGKPVAGPPGSRGEPGASVVGPRGPQGKQGDVGPVGPTGPVGPSGAPGKNGENGDNGENGTDGVGQPGASGSPGTDGVAGPAGPQGEPGPAGPQGEQGPPGADGKDGADGQTCPDGYSLQPPPDDPDALVCRRDSAPPPDSESPTPLVAGLDPQRRVYA